MSSTRSDGRAALAPEQVPVLIAGGGPVGLTLALTRLRPHLVDPQLR